MTKKELSQLYYLKKEIALQKQRLLELETIAYGGSNQISSVSYSTLYSDKVGLYAIQIADLKAKININLKKYTTEVNRLESFIQNVNDSQMRLILTLRYIKCLSWKKIAYAIGEHDEQYPRKKHNNFLKSIDLAKL